MTEEIWNVRATVVALVPAQNEKHAIDRLYAALDAAGFAVYDALDCSDAFESESLDGEVEDGIRYEWQDRK